MGQYREYLDKLGRGDGYAEKIANERMVGALQARPITSRGQWRRVALRHAAQA
jgi:hypothetical protein